MDDKNEQLLLQYDISIINSNKVKGNLIIESKNGIKILKRYDYSEKKAEIENNIRIMLFEKGYEKTDIFLKNKEEKYITLNKYGNQFILKNWFKGEECNISNNYQVLRTTKNLAILHKCLGKISLSEDEKERIINKNIHEDYNSCNKEIKHIKKYVLNKKKKNQLEILLLNSIDKYYDQGCKAIEELKAIDYSERSNLPENNLIYHGSYNHHNVILNEEDIATISFNHAGIGMQLFDLYSFMRKTLEKNEWDISFGDNIINEYSKEKVITSYDMKVLYIMFLYPEKFQKLANAYYNGHKIWVSGRIIQKLEALSENEANRQGFLSYIKRMADM